MAEGGTGIEYTRSGRTLRPPNKYKEFDHEANGRPGRDRLPSATDKTSTNRSRPGSRRTSPDDNTTIELNEYQESDTEIEELLEHHHTPSSTKPKGQCVQSNCNSQRQCASNSTPAATSPLSATTPAIFGPDSVSGTSPVTVTINEVPSQRNLPCKINYAVGPQSAYSDKDSLTFDRSQVQSNKPETSPKCGQCKQHKQEVLKCERCLEILCAKCQQMDTAHLLILKQYDVSWFCNKCKPKALNAIHTDKEIEDRCAEYMSQITKRIIRVETSLKEKATKKDLENSTQEINTQIQTLQQEVSKLIQHQTHTTVNHPTMTTQANQDLATAVKEEITEREQIMAKKLNLIIHGMKENGQDLHEVKQMMTTCLKLDAAPESVTRIGQPDHSKPRMILAVMRNINDKKKVLSKAKEIRNSSEERYNTVFIRPDLTPRQRAESKNLQAQLMRRREDNPNKTYKIYRSEIIETQ